MSKQKSLLKKVRVPVLAITSALTFMAFAAVSNVNFSEPTGPYGVGTATMEMEDESRKDRLTGKSRKLLVQFYYPSSEKPQSKIAYTAHPEQLEKDLKELYGIPSILIKKISRSKIPAQEGIQPAVSEFGFPLLIFSHGYNGNRFQNSFLLPELASRGYIIASIEHPGAASGTVLGDGSTPGTTPFDTLRFDENFSSKEILTWSRDQQFVLDFISDSFSTIEHLKEVDLNKVGLFGHSFGGASTAASLSQDSRFLAGINMDGFYFGINHEIGFDQPFLEMRSETKPSEKMSEKELKEWKFTREEYQYFFFDEWDKRAKSYAKNGFERITLLGSSHMSFSDFTLMMPIAFATAPHRKEHHEAVIEVVSRFFDFHLKGINMPPFSEKVSPYLSIESYE